MQKFHHKTVPGSPDIKLTKYKILLIINGFLGINTKSANLSVCQKQILIWKAKIEKNITRDKPNKVRLIKDG